MKLGENFWPKAAILLGIVSIIPATSNPGSLTGGLYMIIGALAYLSAKKRKSGLVEDSTMRKTFELIGIAIICLFLLVTNKEQIINDPFPNFVIPVWAIIAYIIIFSKTAKKVRQKVGK